MEYVINKGKKPNRYPLFGEDAAEEVISFHRSIEGYSETPLTSLPCMAQRLGTGGLYVKDESFRFGLGAFKALGSLYAMERMPGADTFVTATDGNHCRAVAYAARRLGKKAVVLMPAGSSEERLGSIRKEGAEAWVTSMNYDDTVREASRLAWENGWRLIQDTTVEGNGDAALYIMQGYLTMVKEALSQMDAPPTHVFLQAGVGSMAGAAAAYLQNVFYPDSPVIVVVEADAADCYYRTVKASDGRVHPSTGDLATIMAGLACGEPSSIALPILMESADCFVSLTDEDDMAGIRALRYPEGSDSVVFSGESGAAGFSALLSITQGGHESLRSALGLGKDSSVLVFSTEGVTDTQSYEKIIS
ncbi:MAG: diaminopropionate ammonia-lyase [Eubacteriaceae bacterium]|nr:diaminopropionate ammonia-lyase [Eubacteriaceae bacterium]